MKKRQRDKDGDPSEEQRREEKKRENEEVTIPPNSRLTYRQNRFLWFSFEKYTFFHTTRLKDGNLSEIWSA